MLLTSQQENNVRYTFNTLLANPTHVSLIKDLHQQLMLDCTAIALTSTFKQFINALKVLINNEVAIIDRKMLDILIESVNHMLKLSYSLPKKVRNKNRIGSKLNPVIPIKKKVTEKGYKTLAFAKRGLKSRLKKLRLSIEDLKVEYLKFEDDSYYVIFDLNK